MKAKTKSGVGSGRRRHSARRTLCQSGQGAWKWKALVWKACSAAACQHRARHRRQHENIAQQRRAARGVTRRAPRPGWRQRVTLAAWQRSWQRAGRAPAEGRLLRWRQRKLRFIEAEAKQRIALAAFRGMRAAACRGRRRCQPYRARAEVLSKHEAAASSLLPMCKLIRISVR